MRRFLVKIILLSVIMLFIMISVFNNADGTIDPFYKRFTSPKQQSLVIGTSRTAQGIIPKVINDELGAEVYNFSFTNANSPFGKVYLKAIKNKIDENKKNGLFIIGVNPWSLCENSDNSNLREVNLFLDRLNFYNMSPNYEYLLRFYDKSYINLLYNENDKLLLHDDGWLEVKVDMSKEKVLKRTEEKVRVYSDYLKFTKKSNYRLFYLERTITFLQNYGEVIITSTPISKKMLEIEDVLWPDFDDYLLNLSNKYNLLLLNSRRHSNKYEFIDGNHLHKSSSQKYSLFLSSKISILIKNKSK